MPKVEKTEDSNSRKKKKLLLLHSLGHHIEDVINLNKHDRNFKHEATTFEISIAI